MRKQYLLLLLAGLMAFTGVMFTGCGDIETTIYFENGTEWDIKITSPDTEPGRFTLKGIESAMADYSEQKVTSKKSIETVVKGLTIESSIGNLITSYVKAETPGGNIIRFMRTTNAPENPNFPSVKFFE